MIDAPGFITKYNISRDTANGFRAAGIYYQDHSEIKDVYTYYEWMEQENGIHMEIDADSLLAIKSWHVVDEQKYLAYYLKFQ